MKSTMNLVEETTLALFKALGESNIRYAVLRNYENFPAFGHDIDLVIHHDDLEDWRCLLQDLAQSKSWDVLTECKHYALSQALAHRIEIFHLYTHSPLAHLQIDVFHGMLILGVPLFREADLLAERGWHETHQFYYLDPLKEQLARVFQIHSLLSSSAAQEKVTRYRQKILQFCENPEQKDQLFALFKRYFPQSGPEGLSFLLTGDLSRFQASLSGLKRSFLLSRFFRQPGSTLQVFLHRLQDQWMTYVQNPCGFALPLGGFSEKQCQLVKEALDYLVSHNVLSCWTDKGFYQTGFSRKERKVMERSGMVLKASMPQNDLVNFVPLDTLEETIVQILNLLIHRHKTSASEINIANH